MICLKSQGRNQSLSDRHSPKNCTWSSPRETVIHRNKSKWIMNKWKDSASLIRKEAQSSTLSCWHRELFYIVSSVLVKVARLGSPILMVQNKLAQHFGKRLGNMDSNKFLFIHVHSSIIHNSQRWKQPKCQLMDEWINKMWYIHPMEY